MCDDAGIINYYLLFIIIIQAPLAGARRAPRALVRLSLLLFHSIEYAVHRDHAGMHACSKEGSSMICALRSACTQKGLACDFFVEMLVCHIIHRWKEQAENC